MSSQVNSQRKSNVFKSYLRQNERQLKSKNVILQNNKFCCIVMPECGFWNRRNIFLLQLKGLLMQLFVSFFSIFLFILFVKGIIVARICILPFLFILDLRNILWETALS